MSEQLTLFDTESEVEKRSRLTFSPRSIGRMAVASVATVSVAAALGIGVKILTNGQPGDIDPYKPTIPSTSKIDTDLVMASFNMANRVRTKADDLRVLDETYNPDIIALQEVSARDVSVIRKTFPDRYVNFVLANPETKFLQGGYGNVLISDQEPDDTTSIALNGNSNLSKVWESTKGFVGDIFDGDTRLKKTFDATQEDRSAISQVIEVKTSDGLQPVRVITTHVGGDPLVGPKVHAKQFQKLQDWIFDTEKDDQATILCMDSNGSLENTTFDFAEEGYITPLVDGTTVPKTPGGRSKAIDQCVYKPAGILRLSRVEVLEDFATDHYAILFRPHR